jgi:hypothetical protein
MQNGARVICCLYALLQMLLLEEREISQKSSRAFDCCKSDVGHCLGAAWMQ